MATNDPNTNLVDPRSMQFEARDYGTIEGRDNVMEEQALDRGDYRHVRPEHQGAANISLGEVLRELGTDENQANLEGDPMALGFPSTHKPYNSPPRSRNDMEEMPIRSAGQMAAAMANHKSKMMMDPGARANAQAILNELREMPAPDATTWIANKRVVVPGEVISVPNKLHNPVTNQDKALGFVDRILGIGADCTGDKRDTKLNLDTGKFEYSRGDLVRCPCLAHRLKRNAQQFGLLHKPINWVGQHMFQICERALSRSRVKTDREIVPMGTSYDPYTDGDPEATYPKAMAALFSLEVADRIMQIAETRNQSIVNVLRILATRICDEQEAIARPKEYTGKYDM